MKRAVLLQTRNAIGQIAGRLSPLAYAAALLALLFTTMEAAPAASVGLVHFTAESHEQTVRLTWETATELDAAGFRLARSSGGATVPLQTIGPNGDGFIPALGSPTLGAAYTVTDTTAAAGSTYTYHLIEVTLHGHEEEIATAAGAASAAPTNTPIPVATLPPPASPTNPPPATATIAASITAPATETAVPPATPTASPPPTETAAATATADDLFLTANTVHAAGDTQANEASMVRPGSRALAAPLQQSTPINGYPPPPTPFDSPPGDQPYPVGTAAGATQAAEATAIAPTPYPVGTINGVTAPTATLISVIGEQLATPAAPESAGETDAPPNAARGRLFLWAGFIIAALIFLTAVSGALLLFTRKRP